MVRRHSRILSAHSRKRDVANDLNDSFLALEAQVDPLDSTSELITVNDRSVPNHTTKPVGTSGTFRLDKSSTSIVDNVSVFATMSGIGRWIAHGGGTITPGGDLSGTTIAQTVSGIQGRPVSATAPSVGQTLGWNGSQWAPTYNSGPVVESFLANVPGTATIGDLLDVNGDEVAGYLTMGHVDRTDIDRMPAVGIVVDKPSATVALAVIYGIVIIPGGGLIPGKRYMVGPDGRPVVETWPATGPFPYYQQVVGVSLSTEKLMFSPSMELNYVFEP